jgi:hypothetical protein
MNGASPAHLGTLEHAANGVAVRFSDTRLPGSVTFNVADLLLFKPILEFDRVMQPPDMEGSRARDGGGHLSTLFYPHFDIILILMTLERCLSLPHSTVRRRFISCR